MIPYPNIDPVAVEIGPLKIHWYGLMYLIGFAGAWALGHYRAGKAHAPLDGKAFDDLLFSCILGLIVGSRLGYVLFYDLGAFLEDPLYLVRIWQGGMSFHGGLIGVILAVLVFARRRGRNLFDLTDFIAPFVPIGLGAGRIGNFINAELWGRPTDLPWGMVFPDPLAGLVPRHPSQLYEAFLEGVVLFTALWFFSARPRPRAAVSGMFLVLYGTFRFLAEFTRQPDPQLGFVAFGWITMGQVLCLPMLALGAGLLWWAYGKKG
ncbi:MAG: prolipoprotein diacylglyceryl transferase [Desulfohalobiaceae bacterium]